MINFDLKWDRRFVELARHVAQWSKDPSTKCGAVVVDEERIVRGLGYNGFGRGVADSKERLTNRDTKLRYVVHAEVNAILTAGAFAKGSALYVWPSFAIPCVCQECAKVAIQAGVRSIRGNVPDERGRERAKAWQESLDAARTMCDEAGIQYHGVPLD